MKKLNVLTIFGTRPETIKCAPVIKALEASPDINSYVCVTGQHLEMLTQMLHQFDIHDDENLELMRPNQTLHTLTSDIVTALPDMFRKYQPDRVLVHGDTTTACVSAMAAFYSKVPVGHIEAGLRSHDIHSPFPEEFNRKTVSLAADMHFAPTERAKGYLLNESVNPDDIMVTGNTVVDALHMMRAELAQDTAYQREMHEQFPCLNSGKPLILVTMHRRENMGDGIKQMCQALKDIACAHEVEMILPVHPNPNVKAPITALLEDEPSIHLTDPLDYKPFIYLLTRAHLAISDSGGIQEEAPSLGVPLLVTRDVTERPEGVQAGVVELVGTNGANIVASACKLLEDQSHYDSMTQAGNLYGDGHAGERIVEHILERHGYRTHAHHLSSQYG